MQCKYIMVWEMWWEWRADQKFPNIIFLFWQEDTKLDRGQHHLLYHHHQLKGTARQKTGKRFWGCKSDDRAVQPAPKHLAECQLSYLALENHFSLCFAWCLVFSKKLRFAILLNKNFFLQYCSGRWVLLWVLLLHNFKTISFMGIIYSVCPVVGVMFQLIFMTSSQ